MRVNYINKNEVNNIYIHDSIFYGYQCDYNNRTISFFCENKPSGKKTYFKFNNGKKAEKISSMKYWIY